ncbi:hypothetical protein AMJ39_03275 [candidate division TA06 bacterium DG_24]|uniref:Uncharacterized protein n=3 Tax=Bacteria division TA06 TaxID=1156500 RepID=A0A0S8JF07_UNCT6|nr:MAG: hypothetical protein AMJ39_03275 [candidate division TA06 bacterium DG_24]KPK70775.1 MAG: hypothetical protein AMJ82_02490 [candidate division TA06 bacterium SM23_40]KPL07429.1 MAG: hypothetical protein AMJ71_09010 [candidate division TA06 bacterium SM1_40]
MRGSGRNEQLRTRQRKERQCRAAGTGSGRRREYRQHGAGVEDGEKEGIWFARDRTLQLCIDREAQNA